MNIVEATHQFERWLERNLVIVRPDLRRKHKEMAEGRFSFFRATSYRWAQHWPNLCPKLDKAPIVIAVGDPPDCSRIDLEDLPSKRDEAQLLWSMGKETANVHLGSQRASVILQHLRNELQLTALSRAATSMVEAIEENWAAWKQHSYYP